MESIGGRLDIEYRQKLAENAAKESDTFSKKTLEAVNRIKAKLIGNDFKNQTQLSVVKQVDNLIKQAISDENICQAWLGWNPFL